MIYFYVKKFFIWTSFILKQSGAAKLFADYLFSISFLTTISTYFATEHPTLEQWYLMIVAVSSSNIVLGRIIVVHLPSNTLYAFIQPMSRCLFPYNQELLVLICVVYFFKYFLFQNLLSIPHITYKKELFYLSKFFML